MKEISESVKIGITVVYFLPSNMEWLLELHLDEIEKNTCNYEFTIYASVGRLSKSYVSILLKRPFVKIVDIEHTDLIGSMEHCYYLDNLFTCALEDGCSHILTLDVDSWPITKTWFSDLASQIAPNSFALAAVLRSELGDKYLPHPCGTLIPAEFFHAHKFSMWGYECDIEKRLEFHQRQDSGFGLAYLLWEKEIKWRTLERTNTENLHFLMAAIYGDCFFHLGATGRLKIFNQDFSATWQRKVCKIVGKLPLIWKQKEHIEAKLLDVFPPTIHFQNQLVHDEICGQLKANPSILYDRLQS